MTNTEKSGKLEDIYAELVAGNKIIISFESAIELESFRVLLFRYKQKQDTMLSVLEGAGEPDKLVFKSVPGIGPSVNCTVEIFLMPKVKTFNYIVSEPN